MIRTVMSVLVCAGLAQGVAAQVVINEVLQNPEGDASVSDSFAEYIELYGEPGMSLTGYAIGLFKGGADNGDDIPEAPAEIDEAFSLDGLTIGSNGLLILYNGTAATSFIPPLLPPGTTSASFITQHIPTTDTPGNLSNDDSSTYLLVRRRPATTGPFPTAFRKEPNPDVNFDGRLDFGVESPVAGAEPANRIDPLQIIDEFAWSDNGGKEYVRDSEQEISTTDGFNPDAVSRVAYYGVNPMLGLRLNSESEVVPTRTADEEFIYGETRADPVNTFLEYNHASYGGPTLQGGDGFMDISIGTAGNAFNLTPGAFNDDASVGITQFRFVAGDLNHDNALTIADYTQFVDDLAGRSLDETEDYIDPDTGLPIADPGNPGSNFQSYVFQGRLAQTYLKARGLDTNDGPGGANADAPTGDDFTALLALICPADLNGDDAVNLDDISLFTTTLPDVNGDTVFNLDDVSLFITAFFAGCA